MPQLTVTQTELPYFADTTTVYYHLCGENPHTLLLDSAEIQSKNSLKSLLFAKSALHIFCEAQTVTFQALTSNGKAVLPLIEQALNQLNPPPTCKFLVENDRLQAEFPEINNHLDEDSKLKTTTVFDGLRTVNHLFNNAKSPIYLGGLFSYDLVANFIPMENILLQDDGLSCPDYSFYLAEQLVTIDHQTQKAFLSTFCFDPNEQQNLAQQAVEFAEILANQQGKTLDLNIQAAYAEATTNIEDEDFKAIIRKLKHHINIGDVFQIVPSRRFSLPCPNRLASYRQLKINNPSPYMFFMQSENFTLFGASPESALKYSQHNRQLEIYPIAGSRPRGFDANGNIDPELDSRLELELRLDQKELAEHLMLVDLARNDVARVSESGTRRVVDLMQIDRYSQIMHLVSRVIGTLRFDLDALHAYQACMNMGTLTGAPKIKAMQLIYQVEQQKRHSYGGAVGYLTSEGNLDTCIVIRSAFVQNGIAYVQAGCGEVLDSDPQLEADETRHKARAVLKAIGQVNAQANG
ncbi:anthranilate synthase subunit I [Mannheimia granulomatis]|uniref:Anthranilate synthase component 1 n=1 Tax=Mannheimia granulomatis TaxID=85402 RepID=A0A011LZ66_9PAST|nr:anthranilate synthase component 1 [Mannheimia granulomatis]EXI62513.1 anthranilate synthase subunit I [Mannheimia granulomatis]RGE47861.1 anthranilate synthase subunit I [Mannheimia granulomatis]